MIRTITIKVKENPIIQKVQINGIDDNSILENLEKITLKTEKYPFVNNKIVSKLIYKKHIKVLRLLFVEL